MCVCVYINASSYLRQLVMEICEGESAVCVCVVCVPEGVTANLHSEDCVCTCIITIAVTLT